jgi:molybdenum cofactor synthesis domain-containing protein
MVDVPVALRMALTETARVMLDPTWSEVEELSVWNNAVALLHNRRLTQPIRMREPGYPPYRASVMDGFAVSSKDSAAVYEDHTETDDKELGTKATNWTHIVLTKVYAGDAGDETNISNEIIDTNQQEMPSLAKAYYVTTGAIVPSDCDCVVPIEKVTLSETAQDPKSTSSLLLHIPKSEIVPNQWIRAPGCDIPPGQVVLDAHSVLHPVALGLLLQSGNLTVSVRRRISVGILSTGNELLRGNNNNTMDSKDDGSHDWWNDLRAGVIPDVNKPILCTWLSSHIHNLDVIDLGMASDSSVDEMAQLLDASLQKCDVIVTTGGISMGETDIVEHVLIDRMGGRLHFGRLNMKPGKPTTLVTIPARGERPPRIVFALPGNPVSALVCTHLLVQPCLQLLTQGADVTADTHGASVDEQIERMVRNALVHAEAKMQLKHDIALDPERPEYHRITIDKEDDSKVISTGNQRSSRLLSSRDAEGLVVLPKANPEHPIARAGEMYTVLFATEKGRVPVHQSMHMNDGTLPMKKSLEVGVVQVAISESHALDGVAERVERALNGSRSGSVQVGTSIVYTDILDRFCDILEKDCKDIWVVVCPKFPGSFRYHTRFSNMLRSQLSKIADSLALQARRGAAAQSATAALLEVVVGYHAGSGAVVVLLPEDGLDSALSNVRGLLKHALPVARGDKCHNVPHAQNATKQ